jgi:hypothetical protein
MGPSQATPFDAPPALRFDFVHPEAGESHFPLPSTGTLGVNGTKSIDNRTSTAGSTIQHAQSEYLLSSCV